jgi:hypothetical protein
MMNFVYEFDSYCTSIVVKLQDNSIVHLRNLDFYFPDTMKEIMYIGKFYRGERYLFDAVMFAGDTGTYTGYKEDGFSITLNQRYNDHSYISLG